MGLPFCGKNPVDPPADENEEHILFIRNSSEFNEVCTMLPDGTDIQVITRYDGDYYPEGYISAKWSSDKTKLVAEGGPGSTQEYFALWLMDMEGQLLNKVTWNGHLPLWAHDGKTIIFSRRRGYFSEIWDIYGINTATGAESTLLYAEAGADSGYIYFLQDILPNDDSKFLIMEYYTFRDSSGTRIDQGPEMIIYDTTTQQKVYLTENDEQEGSARISPDGMQLIYTRKNTGVYPFSNNLYLSTINVSTVPKSRS